MLQTIEKLQSNFLLRRLHSLSGIVPIGAFMVAHLFANSVAVFSPENYNTIINFLRSIPYLEIVEFLFLFAPILFHIGYGILIYKTARPNQMQYSHLENWRYFLQRVTGVIGIFYVWFHVFQFRFVEDLDYDYVASSMASNAYFDFLPQIPFINPMSIYWIYMIGVISLIYHFANGIWGFCITWGITVGKKSQEMVSWVALGVFIVLSLMSIETINSLAEAGHGLLGDCTAS